MAWQNPKKDWKAVDVPNPNDFNRIEGNIDELDGKIDSEVDNLDTKKLNLSGGTMTGNLDMNRKQLQKSEIKDYSETVITATGVTGTKTLDLSQGNVFDMTLSGTTTFVFSNPSASGKACSFTLIIRQPSTLRTVTFPSSVKWDNDVVPDFATSKTAILTFVTVNGGTRWYGVVSGTRFTT